MPYRKIGEPFAPLGRSIGSLRGAPASAFAPTDLANLLYWIDLSDITTLFQDNLAAVPVTANADPVGTIQDKSTNSFDVTQANAGNKPSYRTAVQNGLSVVRFDGGSDYLQYTDILGNDGETTIFAVVIPAAISAAARMIFADSYTGASSDYVMGYSRTAGRQEAFWANSIIRTGTTAITTVATLLSQRRSGVAGAWTIELFVNGAPDNGSAVTATNPNATPGVGQLFTVGRIGMVSAFYLNADLCELIIYSAALTDAQKEQVETYLNNKWAIY